MKVLQINAVSGISSTGRTCIELAQFLDKCGYDSYIAYSDGPVYDKGFRIGNPFEIKLHGLLSRVFGLQAYFSVKGTLKLLKYMDALKPDVVHLRNLHGNYINLRLLLSYLAKRDVPTVITLHDCWFYTGKCCHYTVQCCSKWQTECFNCPRIHKDNPSWIFDCTRKMFRDKKNWLSKIPRLAVVGVSDWITEEAKKSFLKTARLVTRIYNWIDTDAFAPSADNGLRNQLGLKNKFIILGIASGWTSAKGLDKFTGLSRLIGQDMAIVLIGGLKDNVELPENIYHISEIQDVRELARFYSMADVFLNLSLEETFGKTTAEALACGTPAIVFNSTANPELVGKDCGFVVAKGDIDELYKKIVTIKSNGKDAYSKKCILYSRNRFSKEDRIRDYIEIYKLIIKGESICCHIY